MRRSELLSWIAALSPAVTRWTLERLSASPATGSVWDHWLTQQLARQYLGSGVPCEIDDFVIRVPVPALSYYRGFEPVSRAEFRRALSAGMRVCDVGANAGYYTVLAARHVGSAGLVEAFEPASPTFEILKANTAEFRNVRIRQLAIGANKGSMTLFLTDDTCCTGLGPSAYKPVVQEHSVEVVRLDDVITPPVDVLKIDVEGAEWAVLDGAAHITDNSPHLVIFIEWSPEYLSREGRPIQALPDRLRQLGFSSIDAIDDVRGIRGTVADATRWFEEGTARYCNLVARK